MNPGRRLGTRDRGTPAGPALIAAFAGRRPMLLLLVALGVVGWLSATWTVPQPAGPDDVPPLQVALIWPAAAASVAAMATAGVQRVLRATAARSLLAVDLGWLAVVVTVVLTTCLPGAVASGSPGVVLRNAAGMTAVAVIVFAGSGSVVLGTLGPWSYVAASSVFGLDRSALGEPRWRWWAWLVDPAASAGWAAGLLVLACLVTALARPHHRRGIRSH